MTLSIQGSDGLLDPSFASVQAAFVVKTLGGSVLDKDFFEFRWYPRNRNAPRRPWTFGTKVTTSRNDYPGTVHRPTEQIINVHFVPFTLSGKWTDRWNEPGYAIDTLKNFERMVNAGKMVHIAYRSIFVDGIITDFEPSYHNESEIHYSFTVSPHSREPGQPLKFSPRTVLNSSQLLNEVRLNRDELVNFHQDAPRFFVAGTLWTDVNDLIDNINTNIDILDNIINQRILLPEVEPGVALKRIAAMFRLVRTDGEELLALLRPSRSDLNLTLADGQRILSFGLWSKGVSRASSLLIVAAERASREMLSRAKPNLIALYRPNEKEHLYKISNQFYGTPFDWKRIATRNNLGSALCMTGEELLIIPEAVARQ